MPRTRKAHRHEVVYLPVADDVPLARQRALYTRLSDDDPDSVSHAHQHDRGVGYANSHDYVITAIYRDWRTGLDPDRLAFRQLVEDAHAGKHGGVIFYDHYRFHRGVTGAYPVVLLHTQLPAYQFEATVGGYDVAQIGIWAGISGMEVDTTRRRVMEQKRRRAAGGEWMAGNKPYWLDREPKTRKPIVVPERAKLILDAIGMYANATPMAQIAAWLSANAPARNGKTRWSSTRVRNALRNPALWGELNYGRSLVVTERRDGRLVVVGRKVNPTAVRFSVPPLIHKTELERTECLLAGGCERDAHIAGDTLDNLIKANNARAGGRPFKLEHPLRRRVVCPCGWRMGFRQKRYKGDETDYAYLFCTRTKQLGRSVVADYPACPVRGISTRKLWPEVRDLFVAAVRNPDQLIADVQRQILAETAAEARTAADEAALLDLLTAELAELDAAENRLYERWDAGEISKAVYDTQTARIASKRRVTEESKRQVLNQRVIVERAERAVGALREHLLAAAPLPFEKLSLAEWTALFSEIVADVVLADDGTPSLRWRQS